MDNSKWFFEEQTDHSLLGIEIRELLHEEKTPYQTIRIFDTVGFGRMLTLDNVIQATELDEFVYHEMLAHVPLHAHDKPETVLIVGGGDGGMVREVSRHDSVKRIVLAEIDEAVIRSSIEYIPSMGAALRDNPKLEIRIGDAVEYVRKTRDEFDVVIIDSSDPEGFAEGLFSREFYGNVYKALRDGGMVTIQGECPWFEYRPMIRRIFSDFTDIFPTAKIYWANIPTYPAGIMVFPVGSKGADPATPARQAIPGLKYYSGDTHMASFVLPPYMQPGRY